MKNCSVWKICRCAAPAMLVFAALAACVAPAAAQTPIVGSLLFQDNFTSAADTLNINDTVADPARQTGSLAGTTYSDLIYGGNGHLSEGNNLRGYTQLGAFPEEMNGPLAMTGNYGGAPFPTVQLNKNLNGIFSQGGMTISFDTRIDGPYWSGLIIGGDPGMTFGSEVPSNNYFELRMGYIGAAADPNQSAYAAFDKTGIVTSTTPKLPSLGVNLNDAALHHFDFVCTDPTDNNPFDGTGQTMIQCYVDGAANPFYTYLNETGFANNYIALGTLTNDPNDDPASPAPGYTAGFTNGNYYCFFDNLAIYGNVANQWNGEATGDWTTAAKWLLSTVPNAPGETARFWSMSKQPTTVTVDADVTVGTLDFDCPQSYTIEGSHTITLDNGTANAKISVVGNHTISAPLVQTGTLNILVNTLAGDSLTLAGALTVPDGSSQNLNIDDATHDGTVIVSGAASPNGQVSINNVSGLLRLVPGGTLRASGILGDGRIWLDGGSLISPIPGSKPDLNVRVLGLGVTAGTTVSYSLDPGDTFIVDVVGGGSGTSYFHFNGGTFVSRSGYLNLAGLTATYLDTDVTLDGIGKVIDINGANLQDGLIAGHLTYINSPLAYIQTANLYTGGTTFTNSVAILRDIQGFGTGPVTFSEGSGLMFWNGIDGTVNNDMTFNGPPTIITTTTSTINFLDTAKSINLAGTITLNNDSSGNFTTVNGSRGSVPDHALTFSGKITGNGGLLFGTLNWPGGPAEFTTVIAGNVSNDYKGDTTILDGLVILEKTGGKIAIPSANVTIGGPNTTPQLRLGADNQINPAAILYMNADVAGYYNSFELMSHSQTIGGIRTNDGLNVISNSFFTAAPDDTVGTLTINSTSPDDYFHGVIRDISGWGPNTSKFALVKDGTGTLTLVAPATDYFIYTGTTTIKAGTLCISSTNTTDGASTSNTLAGAFTGAGDFVVGDGVNAPVLTLAGPVSLTGTTTIETGSTLKLSNATSVDSMAAVNGPGSLVVEAGTTLTAGSIRVGSLSIGGAASASAVPEPSAFLLLAIAGAAIAWFRSKK